MTKLETLLACIPDAPFKQHLTEEIEKLIAERDALALAVENSGNRHIYDAPDGMVFMPEGTPQEITTLKAALREAHVFLHHCWRDVQMNDYSFEYLEKTIATINEVLK
jgi:hypothetical protein